MSFDESLVGYPETKPKFERFDHGWFLQTHKNVFSKIIKPKVKTIVEIGSWYGASTRWLAEHSSQSTKVYAIDLWDDEFIKRDNHYGPQKYKFLRDHPLYPTFLVNLWEYKDRVTPIRMDGVLGLEYLKSKGVEPDIIYIDADHHYDAVKRDIQACLRLFPKAILVGDDYGNYEDVRRAVHECANDTSRIGKVSCQFDHSETFILYQITRKHLYSIRSLGNIRSSQ
jgi:Methyltransferase domain